METAEQIIKLYVGDLVIQLAVAKEELGKANARIVELESPKKK